MGTFKQMITKYPKQIQQQSNKEMNHAKRFACLRAKDPIIKTIQWIRLFSIDKVFDQFADIKQPTTQRGALKERIANELNHNV